MKKIWLVSVVLLVFLSVARAATIDSININYVSGGFTAGNGIFGDGSLSFADGVSIVVEDAAGQQTVIENVTFSMETYLFEDSSVDGIAKGLFKQGSFGFSDSAGNDLLSGMILEMSLGEPFDDMGIISGKGDIQISSGSLKDDFDADYGLIFQINFGINPPFISDFSQDFACFSNCTFAPLPEPMTVFFMGMGGLALLKKRK